MSSSMLPWKWVIEYLADVPDVGTSILSALVDRFPEVLADSSGAVRERLSLRYLEECSGMACGETPPAVATNAPSTSNSAPKIDAAKTCEEVLLSKVATANVYGKGKAVLDDGDLHQFILQKRAKLPEPSIDLLKAKVLGSYPDFSYKKKCNGLPKVPRPGYVDHPTYNNHGEHDGIKKILRTMKYASPCMKKLTIIRKYIKLKKLANSAEQHFLKQKVPGGEMRNQQNNVDGTSNVQVFTTEKSAANTCEEFHDVGMQSRTGYVPAPNCDPPDNLEGSLRTKQSQKQNVLLDRADLQEVADGDCDDLWLLEQISMNQSSSAQSLCMKCGRSGQLLKCRSDGCSRSIHESCLVLLASVEKNGLFYCPLCAYKNARMMYKKAKRKAEEARRNLYSFYDIGPTVHVLNGKNSSEKIVTGGSEQVSANQNSSEHPDLPFNHQLQNSSHVQKHDDVQNTETSNSNFVRDNNQGITQNQLNGEVDMVCKIILPCRETIERHTHEDVLDTPMKLKSYSGRELESTNVAEDQQPLDDHGIIDKGSLTCDVNTSHERNDDVCVRNSRNKVCRDDHLQGEEIKNLHPVDEDQKHISLQAGKRSPLKAKGERDHNAKRKALASQIIDRFAKRNKRDKAVKFGNYHGNGDNQLTDISSSRELRKNKYLQNHSFILKRSPSRRTKLAWKPEEEKILEEAMQKIPKNEDGGIPWIKILEYGHFFLHESRTPIDLKDKWRNMQKKKAKKRVN